MAQTEMYWQERPHRLLLDRMLRKLSPVEFAGMYWLVLWSKTLAPPGVLPADEETLQECSRLSPREWKRARETILGTFARDATGNFHHLPTVAEYTGYVRICYEKRLGALKRGRSGGKKASGAPQFVNPYARFGKLQPPLIGDTGLFTPENTGDAYAQHMLSISNPPVNTHQIDRLTERKDLSGGSSPALAAETAPAALVPNHHPPPHAPPHASPLPFPARARASPEELAERRHLLQAQIAEIERQKKMEKTVAEPTAIPLNHAAASG